MNIEQAEALIRAKVVVAVPEIMELKFGCHVLVDDEVMVATHWNNSNDSLDVYAPERANDLHHTFNLYPKEYNILGRPIRLADVLAAVNKTYEIQNAILTEREIAWTYWHIISIWNLSIESVFDQTDGFKLFLANLLQ